MRGDGIGAARCTAPSSPSHPDGLLNIAPAPGGPREAAVDLDAPQVAGANAVRTASGAATHDAAMLRPASTALTVALAAATLAAAGGCGGSNASSSSSSGQAALSADARSAATGDIPDNQSFLTFVNAKGGYSIRYPEGWAQSGGGRDVTFRDKNNVVHVVIAAGGAPTVARVKAELARLTSATPTLRPRVPQQVTIKGKPAVKVVYETRSAPNPVTGKRVTLVVDRYELAANGRRATVDLGTPRGVDNVDGYRMMIESFRWR
jgi:hypothetical protein